MASQLGSAITPGGHAAFEGLLANEQQNRARGLQAMGMQQNMALAQQQMGLEQQRADQQAALEQQRMGMAQNQFEAGLLESQRQREHEASMLGRRQEFEADQASLLQNFQREMFQKEANRQTQIELIHAKAEAARASGDERAARAWMEQEVQLRRESAAAAIKLQIAKNAPGKTQREIQNMVASIGQQLQQMQMAEQHSQDIAKNHTTSLLQNAFNPSIDAAKAKWEGFVPGQRATMLFGGVYSPSPTEDIGNEIAQGRASSIGVRWLNLDTSRFGRITHMLPGSEHSSMAMVGGEVDGATMTKQISQEITDGILKTLPQMGIKNYDESGARELFTKLLSGSCTKQEAVQLATAANIPPTTIKYLMGTAADLYSPTSTNKGYMDLVANEGAQRDRFGGLKSLNSEIARKSMEDFKIRGSLFRTAYGLFDHMNMDQIKHSIGVLEDYQRTGRLGSLAESEFSSLGLGREFGRLRAAAEKEPEAVSDIEQATGNLGELAGRLESHRAFAPLVGMAGRAAGAGAEVEGLQGLLGSDQ